MTTEEVASWDVPGPGGGRHFVTLYADGSVGVSTADHDRVHIPSGVVIEVVERLYPELAVENERLRQENRRIRQAVTDHYINSDCAICEAAESELKSRVIPDRSDQ